MTEVQNFMLVVCFGCTIGFLIGTVPGVVPCPAILSDVFLRCFWAVSQLVLRILDTFY